MISASPTQVVMQLLLRVRNYLWHKAGGISRRSFSRRWNPKGTLKRGFVCSKDIGIFYQKKKAINYYHKISWHCTMMKYVEDGGLWEIREGVNCITWKNHTFWCIMVQPHIRSQHNRETHTLFSPNNTGKTGSHTGMIMFDFTKLWHTKVHQKPLQIPHFHTFSSSCLSALMLWDVSHESIWPKKFPSGGGRGTLFIWPSWSNIKSL